MNQDNQDHPMQPVTTGRSRREFLVTGGLGAAAAMLAMATPARAADGDIPPEIVALEAANLKLVNDFCAAWATKDADKLGEFFAEDAVFRMNDNAKPAEGKATIVLRLKAFLGMQKKAEFIVNRSAVMGNLVLNDRYDRFEAGTKKQEFHMTGIFLVKNNKIQEWHDFSWPRPAAEAAPAEATQ